MTKGIVFNIQKFCVNEGGNPIGIDGRENGK